MEKSGGGETIVEATRSTSMELGGGVTPAGNGVMPGGSTGAIDPLVDAPTDGEPR